MSHTASCVYYVWVPVSERERERKCAKENVKRIIKQDFNYSSDGSMTNIKIRGLKLWESAWLELINVNLFRKDFLLKLSWRQRLREGFLKPSRWGFSLCLFKFLNYHLSLSLFKHPLTTSNTALSLCHVM